MLRALQTLVSRWSAAASLHPACSLQQSAGSAGFSLLGVLQLLAPGELTPGIQAAEYMQRRQILAQLMTPGSVAVLPAAGMQYMTGIIPYTYRQDADFMYLTGINQRAVAVLKAANADASTSGQKEAHLSLFLDPPDEKEARWTGTWLGAQAAQDVFGAHEVYSSKELPKQLTRMTEGASAVYFDKERSNMHQHASTCNGLVTSYKQGKLRPLQPLLHALRNRKSPAEVRLMRQSARLAAFGLRQCMAATRPGIGEYQLAALFEYECKVRGALRIAFPTVVASGPDACTIHYGRNDKQLQGQQLLLMDAGCEYHGYVSDVTRTWPISGKFSSAQRDVYELVLDTHHRCVEACRPGASLSQLHDLSIQLLSEGIKDLGLLPGVSLAGILNDKYKTFYFHALGHWLGLDTHDTHLVERSQALAPGNVITTEPGLYIPDEEQYGALRGIGVRIEDVVLVTEGGCDVLSKDVPCEVADVEGLVASALTGLQG